MQETKGFGASPPQSVWNGAVSIHVPGTRSSQARAVGVHPTQPTTTRTGKHGKLLLLSWTGLWHGVGLLALIIVKMTKVVHIKHLCHGSIARRSRKTPTAALATAVVIEANICPHVRDKSIAALFAPDSSASMPDPYPMSTAIWSRTLATKKSTFTTTQRQSSFWVRGGNSNANRMQWLVSTYKSSNVQPIVSAVHCGVPDARPQPEHQDNEDESGHAPNDI